MRINGHTRMAAVVAKPIKHSISPLIHNMAFEKTGVNGVYLAWEVEVKDLQASIENIRKIRYVWCQSFHALQAGSDPLIWTSWMSALALSEQSIRL